MSWRLVAPFDNTGNKGLAAVYPPETVARFAADVPGGETATAEPGPAALAALLNTLLA